MSKQKDKILAGEIMTKNPYIVKSSMGVDEVAQFFLDHKFTSAPVIGPDGQVFGILDEINLIKIKTAMQTSDQKKNKLSHHVNSLLPIHVVVEHEPMLEVMRQMMRAPNHRLFVLGKNNAICGIISPKDILRYIVGVDRAKIQPDGEIDRVKKQLEQTLKELKKTKNRLDIYQEIVMENPIMIHSVDAKGHIIMANKKMHETLGYKAGELINKSINDLYAPEVHDMALEGLKTIMKKGSHKNTHTVMLKKNGDKARVDVASAALHDDKGQFLATISVSREIESDVLLRTLHGIVAGEAAPNSEGVSQANSADQGANSTKVRP